MTRWMAVLGLAVVVVVAPCPGRPAQADLAPRAEPAATGTAVLDTELATEKQRADYSLGVQMGRSLKNQGMDVDAELVIRGLRDALAGRRLLVTEEQQRRGIGALRAEVRRQRVRDARMAAEENRKAGEVFLAANGTQDGVVTLPSGLQYRVLDEGAGRRPTEGDTVEVRYRGRLLDGTEFDSSFRSGRPAIFPVKGSIPGWRQALSLMSVGSRWELFVPARLAYGPRGTGLGVGPEATVVFEVELLAIK